MSKDNKKHEGECGHGCNHPFHDHDHKNDSGPFKNTKRWGFNPGVKDFNPWTVDVREVVKSTEIYKKVVGDEENYDEKAAGEIEQVLDLFASAIDNIRHMFDDPEARARLAKELDLME